MIDFRSVRETRASAFDFIHIRIASPEEIRGPKDPKERERLEMQGLRDWWSWGEVLKPETINYRSFKPEKDGLFCERIFGPVKDWECHCGKYKRIRYRGVICDRCGVEVTLSKVRRERMGHIELAVPVAHIWFFKTLPSPMGNLLDITLRDLEKIIYYSNYVVIEPGDQDVQVNQLLDEEEFLALRQKAKEEKDTAFMADIGAPAARELLRRLDVDKLADQLRSQVVDESSQHRKKMLLTRLKIVDAFRNSGDAGDVRNKPEWMSLDVGPVIPPDLRPLVPLDGGRFATSDLNDLYRRVINRNNRLKRLIELRAPDIIIRNEKRMLQEAVDALFDNGRRGRVITGANKRPLKSLADMLKGKQGRFRQNLLGKRVDYSGRSVIVVGPELKLHQCGLPKKMALELFKPFVMRELVSQNFTQNIKSAKRMVERVRPEVWDVLDQVITDHPVLLNRAPTLHRLGIQAFMPVLVEGQAIQIHPLVCKAFNADFDGDQMAVHLPLSAEAQAEARILMLSANNILSLAHGAPIAVPTQDMVLGLYYLTKARPNTKGEGRTFASIDDVLIALEMGEVETLTPIKLRYTGKVIDLVKAFDNQNLMHTEPIEFIKQYMDTTVGRVILNDVLPSEMPFINGLLKKKGLAQLVQYCYLKHGLPITVNMLDKVKALGFLYATRAGISIGIDDMIVPGEKAGLVRNAEKAVIEVVAQYQEGAITHGERYNKIIEIWSKVTERVSEEMFKTMEEDDRTGRYLNPIYIMADSGARGSKQQIRQLSGMRGLMAKPSGEIIEQPITANFREGLDVLQYFISTHGARKGLADTALKTADSGYLTRRLCDVAQDVIVTEDDCGTSDGIYVEPIIESGEIIEPLRDRIVGRVALEDQFDYEGNLIVGLNKEITEDLAGAIQAAGIDRVKIRSVLTCESKRGVCQLCYGRNLATGRLVERGEAVGIISAQSIGEPGTQLTMRTFHIGGAATGSAEQSKQDVKSDGFVKFLNVATVKNAKGELIAMTRNSILAIVDDKNREKERYQVVYGAKVLFADGAPVKTNDILLEWDPYTFSILTDVTGVVHFKDLTDGLTMQEQVDEITGRSQWVVMDSTDEKRVPAVLVRPAGGTKAEEKRYLMPMNAHLMVADGDEIHAGDVVAKIPRATTKTKDITGGLPRVGELFEARKPRETAIMAEVTGVVKYGEVTKGSRKVCIVSDDGEQKEYSIPRGVHINVQEGERVKHGDPLMVGPRNPHDIMAVMG